MRRKNCFQRMLLSYMPALLMGGLFASCSLEDMPQTDGIPLSDGEYPLTITARMEQMNTRSSGKDEWTDSDAIGVRIGADGATGCYKLNTDGTVKETVTPVYWQNTSLTTVTAWYPYEEQINVDIDNQKDGFAAFDFLTATAENQSYRNHVTLEFHHQMAKVSYALKGDGVTDEELKTAVVTLFGDATATFKSGVLAPAEQADGEIVSCYDGETLTGTALLVPQDMTGKPFIQVSIGNDTFTYIPTNENAGLLQAGYQNTYTITVKAIGIEVTAVTGGEWRDDGSEDVTSRTVLTRYTANDVKKGDYIYEDGSVSDGGLRTIYTDGTMICLSGDEKPKPEVGKTVVGVVFWTPSETTADGRITPASLTDDKIMAAEYPACTHGLAVAMKNTTYGGNDFYWQSWPESVADWQAGPDFIHEKKDQFVSIASYIGISDNINRIYGYQNTIVLRAYNVYCSANDKQMNRVKPVESLDDYIKFNPAPANSTGWFFPSLKELKILFFRDADDAFSSTSGHTLDIVNASLSAAGGDAIVNDSFNKHYWSSSENVLYYSMAFKIAFSYVSYTGKTNPNKLRGICAF